jgi:hypothetical protein
MNECRMWDSVEKKMVPYCEIIPSDYTYDGSLEDMFSNAEDEGCVFLPYIGRKDKHGKTIHKGDIVAINEPKDLYEVVFQEGAFVFSSEKLQDCDKSYNSEFYEIIGNRFENPELYEKLK